jgi:hypothetical protein
MIGKIIYPMLFLMLLASRNIKSLNHRNFSIYSGINVNMAAHSRHPSSRCTLTRIRSCNL